MLKVHVNARLANMAICPTGCAITIVRQTYQVLANTPIIDAEQSNTKLVGHHTAT